MKSRASNLASALYDVTYGFFELGDTLVS